MQGLTFRNFFALVLQASYSSAGLAQKKKKLALRPTALLEINVLALGKARIGTDTDSCLKLQANPAILDNHCYTIYSFLIYSILYFNSKTNQTSHAASFSEFMAVGRTQHQLSNISRRSRVYRCWFSKLPLPKIIKN